MNTEHLLQGLQVFIIGVGGVFLVLVILWICIALLGRILGQRPEAKQGEPKGTA